MHKESKMKLTAKILSIVALLLTLTMVLTGCSALEDILNQIFGQEDPPIVEDPSGFTISAENGDGLLYFSGSVTDGRFDGVYRDTFATLVNLTKVEGGYIIHFVDKNETTQYIVIGDTAAGAALTTDKFEATIFEWNSEIETYVVADDANNRAFGVGKTSTFTTFSCYDVSNTTYNYAKFTPVNNPTIEKGEGGKHTGGNGGNGGGSEGGNGGSSDTFGVITSPVAGTAYKFGMVQENLDDVVYYLAGGMDGYYMATTISVDEAIDVYLEETSDGYYLYCMVDGAKTYINFVVSGEHVNGAYEATPSTVFKYDTASNTVIANIDGADYWLATRNDKNYTTMGPCKTSYNGFYGQFYGVGGTSGGNGGNGNEGGNGDSSDNFGIIDAPVAGTAYKFGMVQKNLDNAVYYLAGGMDGYYMATTTSADEAIDVYLEEVSGGYHLYTIIGGAKTYINFVVSGTHVNGAYEATASTVYRYDAESKTVIAEVDGADYWLATRNDNTYTTMGPCKTSYEGFYGQFYGEGGSSGGNGGDTPTAHTCESKCDDCGKCKDAECTETACIDKCECVAVEITTTEISAILAGEAGKYQAEGTVIAINGRSFLLKDATGTMLVYLNTAPTVAVGDVVTVVGTTSVYGCAKQFGEGSTVTKTGTAEVSHGTPVELTAAECDAYLTTEVVTPVYVKLTGVLSVNGNYMNLPIDGATIIGSLTYLADDLKTAATALNGKTIVVEGYVTGVTGSSSKYLNLMVVSVEEVVSETPTHSCESVCPDCGLCLDADCTEDVCASKCQGHNDPVVSPHTCESVCPDCGKCQDTTCEETVCASKCAGHEGGNTGSEDTFGIIEAPVAGTAYKFGMVQKNCDNKVYYLAGGMNGYYMATTENVDEAIDVYLEEVSDGYHLYTMIGGAKTYINFVVSGTHVNGAYEATASTVYRYDAESKTVIAEVGGADYWLGTRNDNTYTTVGPCKTSYEGFYGQFYGEGGISGDNGDNEGGNTGNEGGNTGNEGNPFEGGFELGLVPAYDSSFGGYYIINNNAPYFTAEEIATAKAGCFEYYAARDDLGRAIMAYACVCNNTRPTDERGDISSVKPTGWVQKTYDIVPGGSLYNRSHLIAWSLTDEDANWENLVTGTEHMNQKVMVQFENQILSYIKANNSNKVLYRVTPIYNGDNLVCTGILMEAYSLDDNGADICFCLFVYNVQPGISIDYATGKSELGDEAGKNSGLAGSIVDDGNQGSTVNPIPGDQYIISANNANGPLYFKGSVTGGRFDCSTNKADAVVVTVSTVDGGFVLSFQMGGATQYIVMDDNSQGGSFTTDASKATVFEWNEAYSTYMVAEDSNSRAFGAGVSSTYTNLSPYDISSSSNEGKYNWATFTKVGTSEGGNEGGTVAPVHTCESVCDECGNCADTSCGETACLTKCQGHDSGDDNTGSTDEVTYTFVLNTKSEKIHNPGCSSVATISESNRKDWTGTYAELQELLNSGYTTCGNCKPSVEQK